MTAIQMPAFPGSKPIIIGRIFVKEQDSVTAGQDILEAETGKGVKVIKAAADGIVEKILCAQGDTCIAGTELVIVKENQTAESKTEEKTAEAVTEHADILIIGGGPGGYVAAIYAAQHGKSVILAERKALGGTCLNVGCIPTKTLIKSAEVLDEIRHASDFGIVADTAVHADMNAIIDRKNKVVRKLVAGISYLMKKNNIKVISGDASLIEAHTAVIASKDAVVTVTADAVIIATGSATAVPHIPGIDLPCVYDSTAALDSRTLPASITIIGGGVIGMEFAFLYRNLGAEVNVIEFMDRLLGKTDLDVSEEVHKIAEKRGIKIHLSSGVEKIQEDENHQAVITYSNNGTEHLVVSEKVLSAVGRIPMMEGIDAEGLKLELNAKGRGIHVDSHMRTNLQKVYAIGDVTNIMQLAHAASYQAVVAVNDILGIPDEADYSCVPSVIFTDPEAASVGLSQEEAQQKGMDITVSRFDFSANGKAVSQGSIRGFVKLIKDNKNNQIIGCAMIGPDVSVLISTAATAIQNHLDTDAFLSVIFPHPTTGEVLHEAALGLSGKSLHS